MHWLASSTSPTQRQRPRRPADVVAQALWSGLELRLLEAVDSRGQRIANAISRDARYRFSHDRVAEAARQGMPDHAWRETHLRIGRRLAELGDDRLFEAARHVGIGGYQLADDERIQFVDVLRRAPRRGPCAGVVPTGPRALPRRSGSARRLALGSPTSR